jgi:hypothetical protein
MQESSQRHKRPANVASWRNAAPALVRIGKRVANAFSISGNCGSGGSTSRARRSSARTARAPSRRRAAASRAGCSRRSPSSAQAHLVCYQAKLAKKTVPQNGCGPVDPKNKGTKIVPKPPKHQKRIAVQINGPLGAATLDTTKEVELCIPSTATLP